MAQIKAAKDLNTAAGLAKARELRRQQVAPPSFNALFIGATDGNTLAELANFLPYYDVSAPQVQFMGPALWAPLASAMASQSALLGAIYAAPDPAAATSFQAKYSAAYGSQPPGHRRYRLRRRRSGQARRLLRRVYGAGAHRSLRLHRHGWVLGAAA